VDALRAPAAICFLFQYDITQHMAMVTRIMMIRVVELMMTVLVVIGMLPTLKSSLSIHAPSITFSPSQLTSGFVLFFSM